MPVRLLYVLAAAPLWSAANPAAWTVAEQERFLRAARIVRDEPVGKGINRTRKLILSDGRRTHAAHLQTVDIYMPVFRGKDGSREDRFKDSWKFEVAAWRLAKLLGLEDMVPPTVARSVNGKPAAVSWWLEDVWMDEKERVQRGLEPADPRRWNRQMDAVRIFDQLIYNVDRSQENILITRDWRAWMIDHTRAFRRWRTLRNPDAVFRCDPRLADRLAGLRRDDLNRELSPFLTAEELNALAARRDQIVAKLRAAGYSARPAR
jgi:hypothetical protein